MALQLYARAAQPDLTEIAARQFVERHGHDALLILEERAETAEELGHRLAATTWRELAAAAARILGVETQRPLPSRDERPARAGFRI